MTRRSDAIDRTLHDLKAARTAYKAAERRLMDARPSLPGAASADGTRGRGGTSSVEALALNANPIGAEIRDLDRVLRRLEVDALWLRRLVERWTPHAPTARDLADVSVVNGEQVDECWLMRRHTDTFEAALCSTNLGGMLDTERHVCRWVYDFARRQGRLPSPEECQRHAAGQTVRVGA